MIFFDNNTKTLIEYDKCIYVDRCKVQLDNFIKLDDDSEH